MHSRRSFLASSAVATLAAPAIVRGRNLNSKLNFAGIGADGKGFSDILEITSHKSVHSMAFADAMPEGEGTVLDHSCLLWINNMWSGSKHDSTKVPLLTLGSLGGTLETGRILDYRDKADDNRKLCSLYLTLMDRMGVKAEQFGDSDTRLARI